MFKIDWYNFVLHNVLVPLRERTRIQWLTLLLSPIRKIWNDFVAYRAAKLYDINHTGQVIYLEKALNDLFDPVQRRIYIDDGDFADRVLAGDRDSDPEYIYHRWPRFPGFEYPLGATIVYQPDLAVYESTNAQNDYLPTDATKWQQVGPYFRVKGRNEYTYGFGFIVYVPITLTFNANRMRALIDFRKVAGRTYQIQLI